MAEPVHIFRADGVTGVMQIIADVDVRPWLDAEHARWEVGSLSEESHRIDSACYREQAREIHEALVTHIPGGLYDHLLAHMMEYKASLFRVPHQEK